MERGVHWRVRPRVGEGLGIGMESVRRREPLAFHSVNETEEPEQFRISVEKREGEGLSWGFN